MGLLCSSADLCPAQAVKDAALPTLPYLGLSLTDLTFIEEGNPEKLNGLINFQRQMMIAKVLERLKVLQSTLPKIPRLPAAWHWIQNLKRLVRPASPPSPPSTLIVPSRTTRRRTRCL